MLRMTHVALTCPLLAMAAAAAAAAAAMPQPPPPAKLGYQYAFPQNGPESPACLDGKAFTITYQLSGSGSTRWSFSLPGGGWCYDELGCLFRANSTGLGQSAGGSGKGVHYKCQADTSDDNCVVLHYCDGSSFASFRAEPWPIPAAVAGVPGKTVTFRGIKNLDATFDWAFQHGLANATDVYIGGASAGGLSTFLHADRLAGRIQKEGRADCTVIANPIDGFFLDHSDFAHDGGNFTHHMQYMYSMMNLTAGSDGALKPECTAAFPGEPWKCFMAPHMQRFIRTPFFMQQSKFDYWQLTNILALPSRPFHPNATQQQAVLQYSRDFMQQLAPVVNNPRQNGGFITSCICHYHCPYGNLTSPDGSGRTAGELFSAFRNATLNKDAVALPGFVVDPSTIPNNCSFRQLPPPSRRCIHE